MNVNFVNGLFRANNENKSVVFCPLALGASLASIHHGASGPTRLELADCLLPGKGAREVDEYYSDLVAVTRAENPSVNVKMMHTILMSKGFEIDRDWAVNVSNRFSANVENYDFEQVDEIVRDINTMCGEKTDGNVPHVINAEYFTNRDPTAIIINGAYFKGWLKWFNEGKTSKFFSSIESGGCRMERYVHRTVNDALINFDKEIEVVAIPFKDKDYQLWMFLPKQGHTLKDWIDSFGPNSLTYLMNGVHQEKCHIRFPPFKRECSIPAKENLQFFGLQQMFMNGADLSAISTPITIISDIIHKTNIEIDEDGAEEKVALSSSSRLSVDGAVSTVPVASPMTNRLGTDQGVERKDSKTSYSTASTVTVASPMTNRLPADQSFERKDLKTSYSTAATISISSPMSSRPPSSRGSTIASPPPSKPPSYHAPHDKPPPYQRPAFRGFPPLKEFIANRPFLYLITFKKDKFLFCGTYY